MSKQPLNARPVWFDHDYLLHVDRCSLATGSRGRMLDAEREAMAAELDPPFLLALPAEQTTPVVFCSPHSGRVYTKAFLAAARLDAHNLRRSEDCYVDDLFAAAPSLGAPLIAARFPRAYVDANREPYELDPELFAERVPAFANSQSVRVVGGLGTIPRIVADGEAIYKARLPLSVAIERIDRLYRPFHATLSQLLETTRQRFGVAVLIDCHSMPSTSGGHQGSSRPHFVLGDRFGVACDGRLTRLVRQTLAREGYEVHLNRPYAGGFITEHYGKPAHGVHALQIEINRALYLDEATLEKKPQFEAIAATLQAMMTTLVRDLPVSRPWPLAAE